MVFYYIYVHVNVKFQILLWHWSKIQGQIYLFCNANSSFLLKVVQLEAFFSPDYPMHGVIEIGISIVYQALISKTCHSSIELKISVIG